MICSFSLSKATAGDDTDASLFKQLIAIHRIRLHALALQYPSIYKYNITVHSLHTTYHHNNLSYIRKHALRKKAAVILWLNIIHSDFRTSHSKFYLVFNH